MRCGGKGVLLSIVAVPVAVLSAGLLSVRRRGGVGSSEREVLGKISAVAKPVHVTCTLDLLEQGQGEGMGLRLGTDAESAQPPVEPFLCNLLDVPSGRAMKEPGFS